MLGTYRLLECTAGIIQTYIWTALEAIWRVFACRLHILIRFARKSRYGRYNAGVAVSNKLTMGLKPHVEAEWWQPVGELIAREGISLREAATRLRLEITNEEAANTFRTKGFQKLLRSERQRFYMEIAQDPTWSRRTAIGKMLYLADRLMDNGEYDKAADTILKIARVEGWLSGETQVTVFNQLSDKELDQLRLDAAKRVTGESRSVPN